MTKGLKYDIIFLTMGTKVSRILLNYYKRAVKAPSNIVANSDGGK